jgi:hypothetical protein
MNQLDLFVMSEQKEMVAPVDISAFKVYTNATLSRWYIAKITVPKGAKIWKGKKEVGFLADTIIVNEINGKNPRSWMDGAHVIVGKPVHLNSGICFMSNINMANVWRPDADDEKKKDGGANQK